MDTCFRYGEKFENIDEFTIDHKESWLMMNQLNYFMKLKTLHLVTRNVTTKQELRHLLLIVKML
jgi:hypothetical protein